MFEFIYSKIRVPQIYRIIRKQYKREKAVVPLLWTEHCIECAAPRCYTTCLRFRKRQDGNCIRIVDGITPIKIEDGVGIRLEFRTWAKIESQYKTSSITGTNYGNIYSQITHIGYILNRIARACPIRRISKFIYDGWFSYRQKYINYTLRKGCKHRNLSLTGIVNNCDKPTTFLVDIKSSSKLLFRESFDAPLGKTCFSIPVPAYENSNELFFINIHPADAEQHVTTVFENLILRPTDITQGKKVKCVIWDLDNTLWNGVLIEDKNVMPNEDLINLIKHLDSCGIVNSIVSKNNMSEVVDKLEELKINDYFVFKKVNWNPKSVNISKTIQQMNINPNTVVFVDDNPFELDEVALTHPKITCIAPSEIVEFSKCNRFNVVVTEDSKNRRNTYKMLESMKQEEEEWNGNIDDFLVNCQIKVKLSKPNDQNIARCYELLQRTNQLNSSGRRLSLEELKDIVTSENFETFVLNSSDKFGDYGIVGFMIVEIKANGAHITDFVISCRVANKKIEPSIVNYLSHQYNDKVYFHYKKTILNGPMFNTIEELNMQKENEYNGQVIYIHKYIDDYPKIVDIIN